MRIRTATIVKRTVDKSISVCLCLLLFSAPVYADDLTYPFYGRAVCSPSTTEAGGGISSGKVYMLGDSITNGAAEKYRTKFTEKQLEVFINASGGSSWTSGGIAGANTPEGSAKPRSEAIVDDTATVQGAAAIVIAIGTNGGLGSNPIDDIINAVKGINPNAPIYWVNTVETATNDIGLGEFNRELADKSATLNYTVVSWAKVFNAGVDEYTMPIPDANSMMAAETGHPNGYVHPNEKGQNALVEAVVTAVTTGGSNTTPSTATSGSCVCSANVGYVASDLPDTVPEPHRSLFTKAAGEFNVNPQYLTALFLSEQGNVWKPFDSPWASSPVGASGPFQFMPQTWSGHATDGNGDGNADIMNMEDAAFSAAHLIAAGTTVDTPLGTLEKPFSDPNTIMYNSAAYNWGGGNIQNNTTPESPLTAAPLETQEYLSNVYTLITSGFTKSGKSTYGDPRMPGDESGSQTGGSPTSNASCEGGGSFTPITADHDTLVQRILSASKIKWGNAPNISSEDEQKQDIRDCLTDKSLAGLLAMAEQSGVEIPINTMARGHGGCSGGTSDHNNGGAIDIGYYGVGDPNNNEDGVKLFKFLYDNRQGLKVGQIIWKMPPEGYQCVSGGQPVDCYQGFPDHIDNHYHHIHVSFTL